MLENVIASAGIRMVPVMDRFATDLNRQVSSQGERVAQQMTTTGQRLTRSVTLPVVGLVAAIGGVGNEFEENLSRIKGLVGATEEELERMRQRVLELGPATGKGPGELSNALFFLKSAGLDTSVALDALEASARASAAGLGDTAVIADAVSSAVNAYGPEVLSAGAATDVLVATVREGKVEADQLAGSIGRVIPLASALGIEFDQVGATLAVMTRSGLDADEAATSLRGIMATLTKPTKEAEEALAGTDLTMQRLRDTATRDGLLEALMLMRDHFGDNTEAMSAIVPNVRALTGVLNVLGQDTELVGGVFDALENSTGALDQAFDAAAETTRFKLRQALSELQVKAAEAAEVVMPIVLAIVGGFTSLVAVLDALPGPVKAGIGGIIGITAVLGPLLLIGGKVVSMLTTFTGGAGLAGVGVRALQAQSALKRLINFGFSPLGVAIGVSLAVLMRWNSENQKSQQRVDDFKESLDESTGAITENTRAIVANQIAGEDTADLIRRAGIDLDEFTDAAVGNASAMFRVNAQLIAARNSGQITSIQFNLLSGFIRRSTDELYESQVALANETDAMGEVNEAISSGTVLMRMNRQAVLGWNKAAREAAEAGDGVVESQDDIEEAARGVIGVFRDLPEQVDLSLAEIEELFRANIEAHRSWSENLRELSRRGYDGMRSEFEALGPAYATVLQSLLDDTGVTLAEMERAIDEADLVANLGVSLDPGQVRSEWERLSGWWQSNPIIAPVQSSTTGGGGGSPSDPPPRLKPLRKMAAGGMLRIGETAIAGEGGSPEILRATAGGVQVIPTDGTGVAAARSSSGGRPLQLLIDGRLLAEAIMDPMVDVIELEAGRP